MTRPNGHPAAARVLPLIVCAFWGGNIAAAATAIAELSPFLAAAIRGGLATLALLGWACLQRTNIRLRACQRLPIAVLSLLNAGTFALQYLALDRSTAAHVAILLYLYPVFTAALAHLFLPGETLTTRTGAGLALGFLGTAVTIADFQTYIPRRGLTGDILAVGSAGLWALQAIYTKRIVTTTDPLSIAVYTTAISGVAFLGLSSTFDRPVRAIWSSSSLIALCYQVIVVDTLARLLWIRLMKTRSVSTLTAYTFATPVVGVLATVVLLDERLSARLLLGATLVALALIAIDRPVMARSLDKTRECPNSTDADDLNPEPLPSAPRAYIEDKSRCVRMSVMCI